MPLAARNEKEKGMPVERQKLREVPYISGLQSMLDRERL